jgi:hypothetical protein
MIIRPEPPASVTAAFRTALPLFLAGPHFGPGGALTQQNHLGGIPVVPSQSTFGGPGPWDHDPQQVFKLGLRDLKAGAGTQAARSTGWRYYAGTEPGTTVLGQCSPNAANGWQLTSVAFGNQIWSAWQASRSLDDHIDVPAAIPYELRFLTIPGILVEAFWLVNRAGGDDFAVVFPAPPGQLNAVLNAESVYPMATFLNITGALAAARLDHLDRLGY